MAKAHSRPLIIFYILTTYIIVQFCWWGYHIIEQNQEINSLKLASGVIHEQNKFWMVIGEGSVFFLLLFLGVTQLRRSIKKETQLANQQKNFLLSITHELKSPLASVRLYLETLLKRELKDSKKEEILTNAISEADRLGGLVDDILMAAKIESPEFKLYPKSLNASQLLNTILDQAAPQIETSHQVERLIANDIYLNIDEQAFTSIVLNLLENAAKYSPKKSKITVIFKNGLLSISDEGIGIPEEYRTLVFEKFYRGGDEETRKSKGTGLGLYIVKFLTNAHNCTISVKDNLPKGTTFEVVFPST